MPQDFQVIRCFSCETFQVHQVKKSNKWKCKLCGESQSVKKVFSRGGASDCRRHVQQMNLLRKTVHEAEAGCDPAAELNFNSEQDQDDNEHHKAFLVESKWSCFLNSENEEIQSESGFTADVDANLSSNRPGKMKVIRSDRRSVPYPNRCATLCSSRGTFNSLETSTYVDGQKRKEISPETYGSAARSTGQSRGIFHQGTSTDAPSIVDRLSKWSKYTSLESSASDSVTPGIRFGSDCGDEDGHLLTKHAKLPDCNLTSHINLSSCDIGNENGESCGARFEEVFSVDNDDLEDLLDSF